MRRPVNGDWAGQGAPEYRTLPPVVEPIDRCARWSCTCAATARRRATTSPGGPASGCGWSTSTSPTWTPGVDLTATEGPDGRTYLDLPRSPAPRTLDGVRLLPEFDALMCGYDRPGVSGSPRPRHLTRLWSGANGLVLPPLLVDGRITGYWRATGSARRRPMEVVWFAGTRRPRKAELAAGGRARDCARDHGDGGVAHPRGRVTGWSRRNSPGVMPVIVRKSSCVKCAGPCSRAWQPCRRGRSCPPSMPPPRRGGAAAGAATWGRAPVAGRTRLCRLRSVSPSSRATSGTRGSPPGGRAARSPSRLTSRPCSSTGRWVASHCSVSLDRRRRVTPGRRGRSSSLPAPEPQVGVSGAPATGPARSTGPSPAAPT